MRLILALSIAFIAPASAVAQTAATPASFNPAEHVMSAAGAPLNDGALPPGTLTVRVVRGGFAGNLPEQEVVLDVLGGASRSARTDENGRATFTDLAVGTHVRASVVVDGERLESAVFPMAPESGIRVLLATGDSAADGEAQADGVPGVPPLAMTTALISPPVRTGAAPSSHVADSGGVMAATLGLAALTFVAVLIARRRESPGRS